MQAEKTYWKIWAWLLNDMISLNSSRQLSTSPKRVWQRSILSKIIPLAVRWLSVIFFWPYTPWYQGRARLSAVCSASERSLSCRKVCNLLAVDCFSIFFFFTLGRRPWAFETDVREFLVLMQNNQLNITDYISSGFSIPGWQQSANPTFILDFINWNKGGWQEQRCRIEEADDCATCGQHTL